MAWFWKVIYYNNKYIFIVQLNTIEIIYYVEETNEANKNVKENEIWFSRKCEIKKLNSSKKKINDM